MLVPGVGMFSFGKDKQTARVAGEFYVNAINVMRGAEGLSSYAPIDESEKFRIEYWALEEAKLQRMPKPKPLATRVALVTGAASGIGLATAKKLASEGACVVIADLSLEKAQAAAAEIGSADVAVGVQVDVSDGAAVEAALQATVLAFGGVDLVVNNAGLSLSRSLLETTEQDWDLQHDVMAKGSFLVAKAAAKAMIEQGMGGDIVYISSKNSIFAGPNNVAYGAAKADQAHQVRLLAAELGEHGIKVNGVNPDGVVQGSGIFASGWGANRAAVYGVEEQDLGKFYAQRTILKREVLPDNIANAVFVLLHRPAEPHDRAAHPRRRGRGGGLPAMTACDDPARRGRRPRGDERPCDGRPRRSGAPLAEGGAPLPQRRRPGRRLALLGRARHPPRGARRCRRGGAHRASCTGSASTPGRWTTACSTATASCSATPTATATRAPATCPSWSPRRSACRSSTPSTACSSCRSPPSSSSPPPAAPRRWSRPTPCSCCPTCSATG